MLKFNIKVHIPITEPIELVPSYALSAFIKGIRKTYSKEIYQEISKAMLFPIYKMFGARFIDEFMVEKPYPDVTELKRWSDYYIELKVFEI